MKFESNVDDFHKEQGAIRRVQERYLLDVVTCDTSHEDGHCVSVSVNEKPNQKHYWDWEENVATPALEKLGFKVIRWFDGERDSFGPLSRVVEVEKNGERSTMWYG